MTSDERRWPAIPRDRILHSWRCTRSGDVSERIEHLATGQAVVVRTCGECHGTDQLDRDYGVET